MTITSDGEHPTDWFTVSVTGDNASLSSIRQVDNGWIVASDSLDNVEVTLNNRYYMVCTEFSTEYPSALIYEIDENTIGIAVDRDDIDPIGAPGLCLSCAPVMAGGLDNKYWVLT